MDGQYNFVLEHDPRQSQILKQQRPKICAIAHNFSGFDGQFVMKSILARPDTELSVIMRGSKIIKLTVLNRVTFIDSLNFLPMALAKFPAAFGLTDGLTKGFYPHLFNKMENYNYRGALPAKRFFLTDTMNRSTLQDFDKWYGEMEKKNPASIVVVVVVAFRLRQSP